MRGTVWRVRTEVVYIYMPSCSSEQSDYLVQSSLWGPSLGLRPKSDGSARPWEVELEWKDMGPMLIPGGHPFGPSRRPGWVQR